MFDQGTDLDCYRYAYIPQLPIKIGIGAGKVKNSDIIP
jgi:hypothetical protein